MPVTPAHAAAAWPVHRALHRLPLAALVIGTFAPDLDYVLRMRPEGRFGHTPLGVFVFCIPVTLLLWWAWRAAVRPALVPLLPPAMRAAANATAATRFIHTLPLAVAAALVGIASHLVWDGLTHPDGWAVWLFPGLDFMILPVVGLTWYAILQHLSSLVGLVAVMTWIAREWRSWPPDARRFEPGQRARLVRAVLFVAGCGLITGLVNATHEDGWMLRLGRLAVGIEAGVAVAIAIYSVRAALLGRTSSPAEASAD
jgi:hypothetical protein